MITDIVAAIAISAKNTPHAIFLLFEMLIFLEFYKCKICETNPHELCLLL